MKKYVSLKQPRSWLIRESVVINCGSTGGFCLGGKCGKPVQIITNYLPLANYLIDQEHDSVIIMGGQYNKSQSITLHTRRAAKQSLCRALDVYFSGKGLDRRRVV
ncbi:hypothetical protein OHD60_09320 [Escherichia coli]|nr:hypothetical protein [Escherichia coli]